MNHEQASQMQAADRYLLGDFSAPERDEFEEHLFECPLCAEEMQLAMSFEANARAVFREQAETPAKQTSRLPALLSWLVPRFQGPLVELSRPAFALASLTLVFFAGWAGVQTLGLFSGPGSVRPASSYLLGSFRTADARVVHFREGEQEALVRVRLTEPGYALYELEFSSAGKRQTMRMANTQTLSGYFSLIFDRSGFQEGLWTLSIYGLDQSASDNSRRMIDQLEFEIKKD